MRFNRYENPKNTKGFGWLLIASVFSTRGTSAAKCEQNDIVFTYVNDLFLYSGTIFRL